MGTHKLIQTLLIFSISSLLLQQSTSWTSLEPDVLRSENRVRELFQQWVEEHGKAYDHDGEVENRFEKFKRNLEYVVERNSVRSVFTVGLNRFTDLSNEDFKERWLEKPVRLSELRHVRLGSVRTCDAPRSLDWRVIKGAVTTINNQGAYGTIEGINALDNRELVDLPEQVLLDCDKNNGHKISAFEQGLKNDAIDDDNPCAEIDDTGYTSKVGNRMEQALGFVKLEESDSALLCAIVDQPIRVGIHGSSIDFQLYTEGIYDGACSSNPDDIDHAVLIVGYDSKDDEDYWIVKNSWGPDWGIDGYMYIRRNTNFPFGVCAINAQAYYLTRTSSTISQYLSPTSSPPFSSPPPISPPLSPPSTPPPPSPYPSPSTPPPPSPSSPPPSPPPSPSPPPPAPPSPSPSPPPPSPSPPPLSPPLASPPPPSLSSPPPSPPPSPSPPPPSPPSPSPSPPPPSPSPPPLSPPLASPPPPSPSSPPPSPPPSPSPPPPSSPSPSPSPPPPSPSPPPPSPPPLPSPSPPPPPPPSSPPSPPPPPYHPIPPSPPPPSPSYCGDYTYCARGQTCCCLYEAFGYCMISGCCDFSEGVCCSGTDYCCPKEYPICAPYEGICLKKPRDKLGVAATKKKMARVKLPWSNHEAKEVTYKPQPLQWRRAAVR